VISMKSFAVLVHESFCKASDECMFINIHEEQDDGEYLIFRDIVCDLKLLYPYHESDEVNAPLLYAPTQYGTEFLKTHNIYLPEENHD
jgi:hypothetical protein